MLKEETFYQLEYRLSKQFLKEARMTKKQRTVQHLYLLEKCKNNTTLTVCP